VSRGTGPPPALRVEQALRLLPDVDALAPLRALLVSRSRARPSEEEYRTVGKRFVQPTDLGDLVPRAVARVSEHLAALYQAAVAALEADQRDDLPTAVRALLRAGGLEEGVGRDTPARAWYEHALGLAEGLRDRRPEIETLRHLGHLEATRGRFEDAARRYQRSLALAEAELDDESTARACLGLGGVAQVQGQWQGAAAWYTRGLRHAAAVRGLTAELHFGLGDLARMRGQSDVAEDHLRRAQAIFEDVENVDGAARVLNAWGALEAGRERRAEALRCLLEALARLQGTRRNAPLEMTIRLNLARRYLEWGRLPDAEDEIRIAEEIAIVYNLTRPLAHLYVVLGMVRTRQVDDTGFVFFEKAIELCRGEEPFPRLEAEVYVEYAMFRRALGEPDEARGCLERAREILDAVGDRSLLSRIDAELTQLALQ
jgi:tetratricopeptide (TPR) repeat protein